MASIFFAFIQKTAEPVQLWQELSLSTGAQGSSANLNLILK